MSRSSRISPKHEGFIQFLCRLVSCFKQEINLCLDKALSTCSAGEGRGAGAGLGESGLSSQGSGSLNRGTVSPGGRGLVRRCKGSLHSLLVSTTSSLCTPWSLSKRADLIRNKATTTLSLCHIDLRTLLTCFRSYQNTQGVGKAKEDFASVVACAWPLAQERGS